MGDAAHWLPPAAVVICALAWVTVEGIRQEFTIHHCVCGHKQGEHDMTWVGSARMPNQDWGRCLKCLCRAFIEAAT